jgi:hypothetical protein
VSNELTLASYYEKSLGKDSSHSLGMTTGVMSNPSAMLRINSVRDAKEPPAKPSARTGVTRGDQSGVAEAVVVVFLLARKAREKDKRSPDETAQERHGIAHGYYRSPTELKNDQPNDGLTRKKRICLNEPKTL